MLKLIFQAFQYFIKIKITFRMKTQSSFSLSNFVLINFAFIALSCLKDLKSLFKTIRKNFRNVYKTILSFLKHYIRSLFRHIILFFFDGIWWSIACLYIFVDSIISIYLILFLYLLNVFELYYHLPFSMLKIWLDLSMKFDEPITRVRILSATKIFKV